MGRTSGARDQRARRAPQQRPTPAIERGPGRPAHAAPSPPSPQRVFQVLGVFLLVIGAVAGVYLAVGGDGAPAPEPFDERPLIIAAERGAAQGAMLAARANAKAAAEAAAAAEAERIRAANEAAERAQARTQVDYPVPASCNEYSGNRALGCALMLEAGWGLDEFPCLDNLWNKESRWNEYAENSSSGAYGIPQALPGNKMATVGADWQTNPVTQIRWGLGYIKNRYGSPCGAWSHSQQHNWY